MTTDSTNDTFNDAEYSAHLDTCALTHAIQDQAYLRHFAAAHLAQTAVADGYTGGQVVAGVGDYGVSTTLYIVLYPARGCWQMWCGYRLVDEKGGRWHTVDCAQHRDIKTLRWLVGFNWNARLYEVNPAEVQS